MSSIGSVDQLKLCFQEEAREIIVDLESALLELNNNRGDQELVGRIFRALHTIKGSGSMFGFAELATFTHKLETAFEEVRDGRLQINSELIDLTLAALDQIRSMVEDGQGGVTSDPAVRAEILTKVLQITGIAEAPESSRIAVAPNDSLALSDGVQEWSIRFAPGPDLMLNGGNPTLLLRELRQLGGLSVKAGMATVPPLDELDPERCYVAWEMLLSTSANRDAIQDVFVFVEDSCELTIEPVSSRAANPAESAPVYAADKKAKALAARSSQAGGPNHGKLNGASLRVPAAKLDQFLDLVGELVTVQARLSELATRRGDPDVAAVSEEIERLTLSLRENSMSIRMVPIRDTFEKFRRLVHDLARDLGKDVELTVEGGETELDKTVIDQLGDPLMHLIRNSMDHGIEPSDIRSSRGKRAAASIHLSARHSGASVLIEVSDDGGGINTEAVRNRAIEKGLIDADASLTDDEIFALIFQPGFSTAKQVTDVSGRGVGMDVVQQKVESLRGTIDVASNIGLGTKVTLRLPLTLAIIDGLLVSVGKAFFVLPLSNILECIELTCADIVKANGKHLANVRGEAIPYFRLREYFQIGAPQPEREQIIVVETEGGRFGFVVDQVMGDCQTVIKNLGRFYRHIQVVSGATILGNGSVALILDPERLVQDALRAEAKGRGSRPVPQCKGSSQ